MDTGVGSADSVAQGMAVRYRPAATAAGVWHTAVSLRDGRLAVAVGDSSDAARTRSRVSSVLAAGGDPAAAVRDGVPPAAADLALCAVIDRSAAELAYSCRGDIRPVVTTPDNPHVLLSPAVGRTERVPLAAGATVLLCSAPGDWAGPILDDCADLHPDLAADLIVGGLPEEPAGAVVLVYRQPPAPLALTVPATPASLATIRSQLRHWLALTGVDAETAADTLLAVGEAASNATEHSVLAARHAVHLTVSAAVAGDRLRFTVADNGRWKPPPDVPSHRGHGIRLINALVDDADLVTDEQGTTVDMVKDFRR